jgi:SAM-dependent methyltransferase
MAFALEEFRAERVERHGARFLVGEFWTARQRQGHALHEISYRACFKAQLPQFFIERLTGPGDTVYDPFMGRGTTPLQAVLMGRAAIGNDINPLGAMLVRPRIDPPTLAQVERRLIEFDWRAGADLREDLLAFYHPETLREITLLRDYLIARDAAGRLDRLDDWIRMVAISRLTGHSPGFFSVYSMPPNQAVSVEAQRRINQKRAQVPPRRSVAAAILKKSRGLLRDGAAKSPSAVFQVSSAEATPMIGTASVDLVVTSPPFLDVVHYRADNWLRCWFAGIDADKVNLAMHRKPEDWMGFVRRVFAELARVVRPGGHVAFEVGEVRGGALELECLVLEALRGLPFAPVGVLINVQQFTKTANCWGVGNNARGTNTNRIVLARRT